MAQKIVKPHQGKYEKYEAHDFVLDEYFQSRLFVADAECNEFWQFWPQTKAILNQTAPSSVQIGVAEIFFTHATKISRIESVLENNPYIFLESSNHSNPN
jgi:hypothetical protein